MNNKLDVKLEKEYCIIKIPTNSESSIEYEIYGTSGYKLFGNFNGELINTNIHILCIPYNKSDTLFYKIKINDKIFTSFIKIKLADDIENIRLNIKKIESFNKELLIIYILKDYMIEIYIN